MELSKQVVSLEIAKKLKELGVKQESLFYWCWNPSQPEPILLNNDAGHRPETGGNDCFCSAFTVAELGELMRGNIKILESIDIKDMWTCWHRDTIFRDRNMANALGKMLIYLLENKLI